MRARSSFFLIAITFCLAVFASHGASEPTIRWKLEPLKSGERGSSARVGVAIAVTGNRAVTWQPGRVRLWELGTGEFLAELELTNSVSSVVMSPSGRHFLTLEDEATGVRLWNKDGAFVAELDLGPESVTAATFSSDGRRIVVATGAEGTVGVFRSEGLKRERVFAPLGGKIVGIKSSPSGDGLLIVFSTPTPTDVASALPPTSRLRVRFVEWATSQVRWEVGLPGEAFVGASFDEKGEKVLLRVAPDSTSDSTSDSEGGRGRICQTDDGVLIASIPDLVGEGAVFLNASGDQVVSFSRGGRCRVASVHHKGGSSRAFHGVPGGAFDYDASMDVAASADSAGDLRVWDVRAQRVLPAPMGVVLRPQSIEFALEGDRITTSHGRGFEFVWDLTSGTAEVRSGVVTTDPAGARVTTVLHPDGETELTATGRVVLWRSRPDGELLASFVGHSSDITQVAVDGSGRFCASASDDGSVRIWSLERQQQLVTLLAFEGGHWMFLTPTLHFLGTTNAADWVRVEVDGTAYPLSCFSGRLHSVFGILGWLAAGHSEPAQLFPPPHLKVDHPGLGFTRVLGRTFAVEIDVFDPEGLRSVSVFTGSEQRETCWQIEDGTDRARFSHSVEVSPGRDHIDLVVQAVNQHDFSTEPRWIRARVVEVESDLNPAAAGAQSLRCMSFNIRYGTAPDGENRWERRKGLVFATIRAADPDLLCVQEALAFQIDELKAAFSEYSVYGQGRGGGRDGEYSAIFVRARKFVVVEHGDFWLSEQPTVAGSKGWDAALPRICTWVALRSKGEGGRQFGLMNTHFDHRGSRAREESARLVSREAARRFAGVPVVVCGDFNADTDSVAMGALQDAGFADSLFLEGLEPEDVGTFHGFDGQTTGEKIDAILCDRSWRVIFATIDRTNTGGRYPSDHFPVLVDLELIGR